ncbi:siderophore-interacting protein [Nocardia lasii]|uniref:Siderophore-interacting protein n=1 Tax=Nocardia lasii TaxID=1616107 RepID=A0ABW1JUI9_9NOCA
MSTHRPNRSFVSLRVLRVIPLTPRMIRVTFVGDPPFPLIDAGPDQCTKVLFPPGPDQPVTLPPRETTDTEITWYRRYLAMPDELRPPMRTYTIRAQRPELNELDIDFVLHPGHAGPGSDWAATAAPGDEVGLLYPAHVLYCPPPEAQWQLLIGDETALPAIAAIIERLPTDTPVHAFIEVTDSADHLRFADANTTHIEWVHRGNRPRGEAVLAALRTAHLPEGPPYAWISGEADLVKHTRRHLITDRGIDKRTITFTGYWRQGTTEEENGRERIRREVT